MAASISVPVLHGTTPETTSLPGLVWAEAAAHAVQNDRLPVRCVVQVLFLSEHGGRGGARLSHHRLAEWTGGSFRDLQQIRSPAPALDLPSAAVVATGARCPSKREVVAAQHHELRRLREDVARLQVRPCHAAMNVARGCQLSSSVSV